MQTKSLLINYNGSLSIASGLSGGYQMETVGFWTPSFVKELVVEDTHKELAFELTQRKGNTLQVLPRSQYLNIQFEKCKDEDLKDNIIKRIMLEHQTVDLFNSKVSKKGLIA